MEMIFAEMQTENFTFRAIGVDKDAAERAILRGWKKHLKQYRKTAEDGYLKSAYKTVAELHDWYGINTYPMELNECSRDNDYHQFLGRSRSEVT